MHSLREIPHVTEMAVNLDRPKLGMVGHCIDLAAGAAPDMAGLWQTMSIRDVPSLR